MGDPREIVDRWIRAINAHDVDAVASCFAPDYEDEAPARRGESVRGRDAVRQNFARLFRDVPDIRAELRGSLADGDTLWMEWRMQGTRADGTPFEFAGVNILQTRDDRLVRGRIYTELVRDAGGIDAQLERMAAGGEEERNK